LQGGLFNKREQLIAASVPCAAEAAPPFKQELLQLFLALKNIEKTILFKLDEKLVFILQEKDIL